MVLGDRTRCDIVTATHAIEVDFADKWAEAIGQSLSYALQLNLKPAIALILEEENEGGEDGLLWFHVPLTETVN